MMLVELTTVPQAALPVAQLREHLRLGSGFADDGLQDGLLAGFLRAALSAIEGRTGKALFEREFRWTTYGWRGSEAAALPLAPVSAIAEVAVVDAAGAETVIPPALWRLRGDAQAPALVTLAAALPTIPTGGAARVDFLGGYGPDWSDLPADLQQAVMLLAAHYYEFRQDTALGAGCMPFGVTALIDRYRAVRLTLGGR